VLAAAILGILFLVYQANKEPSFNPPPARPKPAPVNLSFQELRKFDGVSDPKVYVALKGSIYDVSSSDFYAVGGGYHQFAGYDASINLAKMSHDAQFLNKHG
jgi:membrane-associated progesterone receptor component